VLSSVALITGVICLDSTSGGKAFGEKKDSAITSVYRSPDALVISPDGKTLYVSDRTAHNVTILNTIGKTKREEIALNGQPRGMALSADGERLYVAERGAGTVAVIGTSVAAVVTRLSVDRWPVAVVLGTRTQRLFVCNQDSHSVSVLDLAIGVGKLVKRIAVVREPSFAALTPDERFLVVTNMLPHGISSDPDLAAEVSVIDCEKLAESASIKLPTGSTQVNGVCTSPDGKWAYVIHTLARFNLPVTQLERGWVNTYALSVIDIEQGTRLATMLLDDLMQGAADPYAIVCSKDGTRLWISHTGTHEISTVRIGLIHELLDGYVPDDLASLKDGVQPNIWVRIQQDRSKIAELANDLTALYIAGVIRRFPSGGKSPRALILSVGEKQLYVSNYFSGAVAVLDADSGKSLGAISLGPQAQPDAVRRGELVFCDATHAFQRWLSCATCHPNDGRVDGLRWDFLRDGIGNPKDTPSLIYMGETSPYNRLGTRKTPRICAETGLLSSHRIVPNKETVEDLLAYMLSLRPDPSPHLTAEGKLSEAALRGKDLFEGKADCAGCHAEPYFTDKEMYNVGVLSHNEPKGYYDTPSLIESHRTAPYLHDGRALTLKDVLTTHNEESQHGSAHLLSNEEIDDLVAYLISL
jgi:DNA-binding beta-propeller fold protein YncE